jgi:hypothetical protein
LPQPEGPTTVRNERGSMWALMRSNASKGGPSGVRKRTEMS